MIQIQRPPADRRRKQASDSWVSADTERKEDDFKGILGMHINVCKGIMARCGRVPYLYADLYAGPGHLEYDGRRFLGSPLIAQDLMTRAGIPHEAIHFDEDPDVASRLAEALWVPTSLFDQPNSDTAPIFSESCEEGFSRWLDQHGRQPNRYGLVYADPIKDEIPHELLNKAAHFLPKVDLLSYVSATQYKRRRGEDLRRHGVTIKPLLADHIKAVNKKVVLIRKPAGPWQWTFVLWSNWVDLPAWQSRGFYRLDSEMGEQILDQLNLTSKEHREKTNTPLPFESSGPPYRSYREYLRHPKFLAVRAQVFERAAGRCERCKEWPPTEPHHLRYPPWGEFDVPENMIAVCHPCHCEIHGKKYR